MNATKVDRRLPLDMISVFVKMTSTRNASSKTLYNLLHEHPTYAIGWSILIVVCVSLNDILKCFQNRGGPTILKDAPCAHDTSVFAMKFRKSL